MLPEQSRKVQLAQQMFDKSASPQSPQESELNGV
jgi:hypothetical protein